MSNTRAAPLSRVTPRRERVKSAAMILTCAEMQALEACAFADGISAERLMEEAGAEIAAAVRQFFPHAGKCVVAFGKGHNGGDALVAARLLALRGWQIELRPAFAATEWSPLTARKHRELRDERPESTAIHRLGKGQALIVLDGLLGIGADGPLREPIRAAARRTRTA